MLLYLRRLLITSLSVFLVASMSLTSLQASSQDHNLTDEQLHVVMGIITNFILSVPSQKELAFEKIKTYASSDGNTSTPSINDYTQAQVTGVDSRTITVLNEAIALLNTTEVDTTAKLQHILDTILSTPPVLTLVGDANLTQEVNTPYTEPGATAIDALDGNLTSSIVIVGSVDIQTLGTQILTYSVTDTDGNTATVERNVTIVDTTPPLFTSEDNSTVAENQTDAITLQATDASAITYSLSGGDSADFDVNATTGVVTFKVAPDFETKDTYTFTATATDAYGNEGMQEVRVNISDVVENVGLKKTGQTNSYDASGNEVTDGSLKDDGHYQKGVTPSCTRDDATDIVTDHITGLQWADDANVSSPNTRKQWLTTTNYDICKGQNGQTQDSSKCTDTSGDTAATYCTNLTLGGYNDWRLPSIEELVFITDKGSVNPAIDPTFENVSTNNYWSSTEYASRTSFAWIVYFGNGNGNSNGKTNSNYVRCVRDGE